VSQSGDYIFDVALLWLVLVTTGSTLLVGLTQAVVVLPQVLAGPIAGVYADRLNRRNIMIASNVVQGLLTAVLSIMYLEGVLRFPYLLLLVLLLFTAAQFMRASVNAILPRVVGKGNLGAANGLLSLTSSANQLVGYALGGVVIATVGTAGSISYDSFTFFFAAAALTFVARSFGQVGEGVSATPAAPAESFWKSFREGLAFVRSSRVFLELIVFGLIANFFSVGSTAILAPYVRTQLHGDSVTYGLSLASVALGAIIGSGVIGKVNFRAYVGRLLMIGIMGFGVLIAMLGLVSSIPLALVVFFFIGVVLGTVNPPIIALMQTKVPNELLGRAMTVGMSLLASAQPIAALTFGGLAGVVSLGSLFLGAGASMFVVSVALYLPFSELRRASY
jgi:DHA3 family macrolide efflux protein-like MFS transporter